MLEIVTVIIIRANNQAYQAHRSHRCKRRSLETVYDIDRR